MVFWRITTGSFDASIIFKPSRDWLHFKILTHISDILI